MTERISSGVEGLDAIIEGGFPKGSLILLAGNPGTGKTIFSACSLVRGAESGEPGIYVSFAEEKDTLHKNVLRHCGCDLKGLEDEGKVRVLDLVAMREEGVSACLETIISEVQSLKAKRLVIDSFSALARAFKEPIDVRIVVHTVLDKIIRKMDCTTIMIEEIPIGESKIGFGLEEFVADGVILFKVGDLDGRLLRELELVKLRGTRLSERKLVFTLEGGFKVFPPFKPNPIQKPKRFQPIPDPPDRFSTGIPDLDAMLNGGVLKGNWILLEVDEKVSTLEYFLIVSPLVANFTAQGRGAFILPSTGVDYGVLRKTTSNYGCSEEKFQNLFLVSEYPAEPSLWESKPNFIQIKGISAKEDFLICSEAIANLARRTDKPILCVISVDTVITLYSEAEYEKLFNTVGSYVRKFSSTAIFIKSSRTPWVKGLSSAACIHLKLGREHGSLLLYGVKPRTGLHAVEMDTSRGYPMPRLTPIV